MTHPDAKADHMTHNTPSLELTPQQRLAISRKAIVRHMQRHDRDRGHQENLEMAGRPADFGFTDDDIEDEQDGSRGHWALVKRALQSWWHHHPASIAIDVAKPLIGRYAEQHPVQLVGIAAGVGVAAVVFKPWRLISVGGVLLAAMKSSDLTGIFLSMLSPAKQAPANAK